jgi:DNA-binding beta-propeller fold protein YncE
VTRITVRTLRARSYPVGPSPYDVTFAGGAAWTTNYGDGTVTRIDAATGRERTLRVGTTPVGIARADGAVWVANQGQRDPVADRHGHPQGHDHQGGR